MRKTVLLLPALILLLTAAGCARKLDGDGMERDYAPIVTEEPGPTPEDSDAFADAIRPVPTLVIEANGRTFYADLEDNASAEALTEKLSRGSVTVDMSDYGGFEKVGPLPWTLSRGDETITTVPGDVILYQGDRITIYYDENTWDFTRLARIGSVTKEDLLSALGEGDVTVTFRIEWSE